MKFSRSPFLYALSIGLFFIGLILLTSPTALADSAETVSAAPSTHTSSQSCPSSPTPRALLAGDSWAQYMWDDNSHNDIFDKFGHADKTMVSESLGSDPGPGYTGSEYSISGSEARQWADTANFPWINNIVTALNANPTIDTVVLSIGGNDILAAKSGGGWYKDMDLDVPGSEAALFDTIEQDTLDIIAAAQAVDSDIDVLLSSYDYPNFNTGFFTCWIYACPKRDDLSRDPNNDLITDAELNDMMVLVEDIRIEWVNADPRLQFDHAIGLMHYYYGDGNVGPGVLPFPGQDAPDFSPTGGNQDRPTLRENFRLQVGFVDADPIHLDFEGYQYKISNQTANYFFPKWRGTPSQTFFSQGGTVDGWTNGTTFDIDQIRVGEDNLNRSQYGLFSFDTSNLPDGAEITEATLYLQRQRGISTSPFESGQMGAPILDVMTGAFNNNPDVEVADATATASASDAGCFNGTAKDDDYAIRIDLKAEGIAAINDEGITQFRLSFPDTLSSSTDPSVHFYDGDVTRRTNAEKIVPVEKTVIDYLPDGTPYERTVTVMALLHEGLAEVTGTQAPMLDVTYTVPSAVTTRSIDVSGSQFLGMALLMASALVLITAIVWGKRREVN